MEARTNLASGVIAFGVVMGICYFAGSLIQTVLVSILLAVLLNPAVDFLGRLRVNRGVAAFLMVLVLLGAIYLSFFLLYSRAEDFTEELPRYSTIIRNSIEEIRRSAERFQQQTARVIPPSGDQAQTVTVAQPSFWSRFVFPGFQTVYNLLVLVSFIPFLVFFMLTWKEHLRRGCIEAFAEQNRPAMQRSLRGISDMVRGYLMGNVLIGLILSGMSVVLFLIMGLRFPFVMGLVSGFLSLIPYLGVPLSVAGPVIIGLGQFQTLPPYLILVGCLVGFHLIALNVLFPKLVGSRVNLNPVAVTLSVMVWGWMWGAMGLVLAVPITAGAKAICDNVEGMQKFGRLLGE